MTREGRNALILAGLVFLLWRRAGSDVRFDWGGGGGWQPPNYEPTLPQGPAPEPEHYIRPPQQPVMYEPNTEYYFWESGGGARGPAGFVGY